MSLSIEAIAAFNDNYIWLLGTGSSAEVCVVDPGDAEPVLRVLEERGLALKAILLTHHHPDHTGGVTALLERFPAEVFGPDSARIPTVTQSLGDGDSFRLFNRLFEVITIPGHTLDHIAFFSDASEDTGRTTDMSRELPSTGPGDVSDRPLLFSGDTLFAAGCGRLFEGDAAMMRASLSRLARLPAETLIYCGHEYTLANLAFARAAEPSNSQVRERIDTEQEKRRSGRPTLPSTLALETRTNPFLRCDSTDLKRTVEERAGRVLDDETEIFAALRNWKDNFRSNQ